MHAHTHMHTMDWLRVSFTADWIAGQSLLGPFRDLSDTGGVSPPGRQTHIVGGLRGSHLFPRAPCREWIVKQHPSRHTALKEKRLLQCQDAFPP